MQDQALRWYDVRWRQAVRAIARGSIILGKIVILLALIALIGCGVVYLISPWLSAHRLSKLYPQLNVVPVSLQNQSVATLSKTNIDLYGFRFLLPNKEIRKILDHEQTTIVIFRDGLWMEIRDGSRNQELFRKTFETVYGDKNAQELLGREVLHSQFSLMQAAMSVTPDQVKWWRFRSLKNKRVASLLSAKFITLMHYGTFDPWSAPSPIYPITSGEFRGFQFGSTDISPYDTSVVLFDHADRYFWFEIRRPGGRGQITQEEINAMVASVRPASAVAH